MKIGSFEQFQQAFLTEGITPSVWLLSCFGIDYYLRVCLAPNHFTKGFTNRYEPGAYNYNSHTYQVFGLISVRLVKHLNWVEMPVISEGNFLCGSAVTTYQLTRICVDHRVALRGLLIGMLSHQLLLQTLGSILLDTSDITSPGPLNNGSSLSSKESYPLTSTEIVLPGLLCHLSPANLSVLFDCLMESHTVAYEFNARPGLRALIQKLARLKAPANLLRQSATAFTYYLHTLFQICRHSGEYFSSSHIKRILTGDRGSNHDKDNDMKEEIASSPGINRHNDLLKGDRNVDWIVRRLHEACDQLSSVYVRLFNQYSNDTYYGTSDEVALESLDTSVLSISSLSSPARDLSMRGHLADELVNSPISGPKRRLSTSDYKNERNNRDPKLKHSHHDEDLRMLEMERQQQQLILRREDDLLQLSIWTGLVITMLEQLLALPTLQFKAVLPAVFSAVTCLIATGTDPKVRQLVSDVMKRVGFVYGIL